MVKKEKQKEIVIFKGSKGHVKLRGDFRDETVWATQAEIVGLFGGGSISCVPPHKKHI